MNERIQTQRCNKSTAYPVISNESKQSKLLNKNSKSLMLHPPLIQTKLAISQPGDKYEQEADRIAEQVMRMSEGVALQRQCTKCDKEEKKVLQAKESPGQVLATQGRDVPPIVHEVLSSPGQPLDPVTRAFMEPRFGYDFSQVRVHSGAVAEKSALEVDAHAYTVGRNIVFGVGQFSPSTHEGRRLIAHELTHVVQQSDSDRFYDDLSEQKLGLFPIYSYAPEKKEERQQEKKLFHLLKKHTSGPMLQLEGNRGKRRKEKEEKPLDLDDPKTRGRVFEDMEAEYWAQDLEKKGYEIYRNKKGDFKNNDIIRQAFRDGRAGPDVVAINHKEKIILVGDITAGAWSQADLKLGDLRRLPEEIGDEIETKPHLYKTVDDARQLARNLPKEYDEYTVIAQDRYREDPRSKYSKQVIVRKPIRPPAAGQTDGSRRQSTPKKTTKKLSSVEPELSVAPEGSKPKAAAQVTTSENPKARQKVVDPEFGISFGKTKKVPEQANFKGAYEALSEAEHAKITVKGTLLNLGAGFALNFMQDTFKDMITDEISQLPKLELDKRSLADFLTSPNTGKSVNLFYLLARNLKSFQDELISNDILFMMALHIELGAIATTNDVRERLDRLEVIDAKLQAYEDCLLIIYNNMNELHNHEARFLETKEAADSLRKMMAPVGIQDFLLNNGVTLDEMVDGYEILFSLSVNIDRSLKDADTLHREVERLLLEEGAFSRQVTMIRLNEYIEYTRMKQKTLEEAMKVRSGEQEPKINMPSSR